MLCRLWKCGGGSRLRLVSYHLSVEMLSDTISSVGVVGKERKSCRPRRPSTCPEETSAGIR